MRLTNTTKLPLGRQSFAEVRELGCAYVDKTPLALKLAADGKLYFLARPRRFGKSLFLNTLRSLFEGKRELFQGLHAENEWDWSVKYPVIKLDMSGASASVDALRSMLEDNLRYIAKCIGVELSIANEPAKLFQQLIRELHAQHGHQVVLLIDEYDKPMIDNIGNLQLAQAMRQQLHGFYSIIKAADEHLRFVMLTGVSKFSKVSIFSGLNNLEDISLNPQYGSICGYTEEDLDTVFGEHLHGVDREQLRHWYNGYNFLGTERVYNPYDILNFIKDKQSSGEFLFENHWFETATPTFVIDLLARDQAPAAQVEPQFVVGREILDSCPIEQIETTTVLFQSGYLTIDSVDRSDPYAVIYKLVCPNHSVRSALQNNLFKHYIGRRINKHHSVMSRALRSAQLDTIESELKRLFASIAADNYRRNDIARFEGYYASVLYSFFVGMGLKVIAEDVSNLGRIDLTIQLADHSYILEFKVVKRKSKANSALAQIIQRGYAAKYSGKIYQIGIEFSQSKRNIVDFAWQLVYAPHHSLKQAHQHTQTYQ